MHPYTYVFHILCVSLFPVNYDYTHSPSQEDEELNSKLCTFTVTHKEFANQHWYYCYTCKLVEGQGVCTICAKVCHKGHELSYSKYGSFFCDCGAKEDGSCQVCVCVCVCVCVPVQVCVCMCE